MQESKNNILQQYVILEGAKQVVCITNQKQKYLVGEEFQDLKVIENGFVITGIDGKIVSVGQSADLEAQRKKLDPAIQITTINCQGKCIIPGFVDSHTHALFAGDRVHEFIMKLQGATYMDIMNAGGGISFTSNSIKKASDQELEEHLVKMVNKMAKLGSTVIEVKSGYGLDTENEIQMLRVIKNVKKLVPVDLVSTYCGAHAIPKGMNEEQATKDVIENQIPAVEKGLKDGSIDPEFIDVFCEQNVYERESTQKILEAGIQIGLQPNFHGDQINFIDSGTLGAEMGACGISHLENLDDNGIKAMAANQVAAILLPTTHFVLQLQDPPVRKMIEEGVIVALGSDLCPNAFCYSMPHVLNLACINYKMTPNEALGAATLNSAAALKRSQEYGSIEVGQWADLVVISQSRWEHILYQFGNPPIDLVLKKGKIIYRN